MVPFAVATILLGWTPYTREYGTTRWTWSTTGCWNFKAFGDFTSWDDILGFLRQDFSFFTSLERTEVGSGFKSIQGAWLPFMVVDPEGPPGGSELLAHWAR